MRTRALPIVLALPLLLLARPATAADFESLKDKAKPADSLASFLETYVGECDDSAEKRACVQNAKTRRKALTGKLHSVRLLDRHGRLFKLDRELGGGRVRLLLTPFFDAAGYGLTNRKPLGFGGGAPRVRLLPVDVKLPEGTNLRSFDLALRTGNVRLDLVFVPQGLWALSHKGETARGVRAAFKALRITDARTGKVLAEHLF